MPNVYKNEQEIRDTGFGSHNNCTFGLPILVSSELTDPPAKELSPQHHLVLFINARVSVP